MDYLDPAPAPRPAPAAPMFAANPDAHARLTALCTRNLRGMLQQERCLAGAGAFDAMSARLVERAGYDFVWASGFSISASKGLPDLNVLSTTELVDRVGEMASAISLPVVVDCDEGYGALPTTLRLVRQLAVAGAAGVCIEDNVYPKSNSFCDEVPGALVAVDAFCHKLRAVRDEAPGLVVVARNESLIQGEPLDAAVRRADAYAASGADVVLMHSKFRDLSRYREMVQAWSGACPLVVIPTLAPGLRFAELEQLGFRMVIYANQALRASIRSMEAVLHTLRATGDPGTVGDQMVTMDYIFRLTGLVPDPAP